MKLKYLIGLITAAIITGTLGGIVLADDYFYFGDGQFTTSDINWRYNNAGSYSNYYAPTIVVLGDWDDDTNVDLTEVYDTSYHVLVTIDDFGDDGLAGHAINCSTGYGCGPAQSAAYEHDYTFALANINHYFTSSMSYDYRRHVIGHEFGHTLSLAHNTLNSSSLMYTNSYGTYAPVQDDIDAINNRY